MSRLDEVRLAEAREDLCMHGKQEQGEIEDLEGILFTSFLMCFFD